MNTRLVCLAAIVLLGFAVSSAVAQPRTRTPPARRTPPPSKVPAPTRTPPPVVAPSGPADCSKIPGCDTCAPGRNARSAPRCSACKSGYVLRSGNCNTCAPGYAGRDSRGARYPGGCSPCPENSISAGGPMTTTQCRACPANAVVVNGKCGCEAGYRLVSMFGSMSCQPCGGMTYSESGNTGATCKTCARGQVPTQERDGCVDRSDAAALTPGQSRLPALRPPSGAPAASNNILGALLGPLTDGAGGRSRDNEDTEDDFSDTAAPTIGGMVDNLATTLDDKLMPTGDGPVMSRDGTSTNLEDTNNRIEAQLRAGNHAGALKTVMDEIVGDLMG